MLSDAAVPAELELDTAVVHDTRVDDRGGLSHDIGEAEFIVGIERGEDVVAVLFEDVDREGQPLVEELGVDTEVELACLLPCQRRVGEDAFDEGGSECFLVFAEVDVHVAARRVVLQVGEAGAPHLVVTYQTVRCTQFEVVDPTHVLHEFLLRDDPADRTCGEYAETVSACEVLRTVVADVEFEEVFVLVVVGRTSRKTHVTIGNLLADDLVLHVVEYHRRHVVVAELAGVVESGLETRRPFGVGVAEAVALRVVGGALVGRHARVFGSTSCVTTLRNRSESNRPSCSSTRRYCTPRAASTSSSPGRSDYLCCGSVRCC